MQEPFFQNILLDLFFCFDFFHLDSVPYYLCLVRVADSADLLEDPHRGHLHPQL